MAKKNRFMCGQMSHDDLPKKKWCILNALAFEFKKKMGSSYLTNSINAHGPIGNPFHIIIRTCAHRSVHHFIVKGCKVLHTNWLAIQFAFSIICANGYGRVSISKLLLTHRRQIENSNKILWHINNDMRTIKLNIRVSIYDDIFICICGVQDEQNKKLCSYFS